MVGHDSISKNLSHFQVACAGATSSFVTRALCQPFDVLKIRFQLQVEPITKSPNSKYQSIPQAFKLIVKEEGVTALWKGHVPAQLLSVVYGIGQFWSFELLSKEAHKLGLYEGRYRPAVNFACGALAVRLVKSGGPGHYEYATQHWLRQVQRLQFNKFHGTKTLPQQLVVLSVFYETGVSISVDYYFSMWGLTEGMDNYNVMMSRIHQRTADRILCACLNNGGTYIKLGQGLVSLSHILPREYTETLKALQDKCLLRREDEMTKLFLEDFGKTPREMYQDFEEKPIAAASLAQVYKAITKEGRRVAVKVQYIDLQKRFKSDVATIDFLMKIVGFMHPNFNFSWILTDLKDSLKQELDFVNEGKNAERCAKDLKHLPFVYVPEVIWKYCSKRVLVTEFIDGMKISEAEELKKQGFSLPEVNTKLFLAFGEQIFQSGFVHADPHPGNVLVRRKNGQTELVLLDHGLYQELEDKDRIMLSHFWKAIVLNNHKDMQKYAHELGVEDYAAFAEVLTQAPLRTRNFKLKIRLSEEDLRHMAEFAKHRFDVIMGVLRAMPRSLILVIRNLNTIRSIAHEHGDPVDRYSVLARSATKTAFKTQKLVEKVRNIPTIMAFEIRLLSNKIFIWFMKKYFALLYYVNYAKFSSKNVIRLI